MQRLLIIACLSIFSILTGCRGFLQNEMDAVASQNADEVTSQDLFLRYFQKDESRYLASSIDAGEINVDNIHTRFGNSQDGEKVYDKIGMSLTVLGHAIDMNAPNCAMVLLDKGANVEKRGPRNENVIMLCSAIKDRKVILLVERLWKAKNFGIDDKDVSSPDLK